MKETSKSKSAFIALFVLKIVIIFALVSCGLTTERPKMEMSMAQIAFIAAKKAKAMSLAPSLYRKAEYYFLKAKSSYRRKYFNKAKQYAILSKKFSERAEFIAIKKTTME